MHLVIGAVLGFILIVLILAAVAVGTEERQEYESSQIDSVAGIPDILLQAYVSAAEKLEEIHPDCTGLTWQILAGIGREESDHAAGHTIDANGDTDPPIVGPTLDGTGAGNNWTPHHDTDDGRWDDDTEYDAAVGVTQLLPVWWAEHGMDGNGDGVADPHNVYDATLSSAVELCTSHPDHSVDFTDDEELYAALHRYNPWDTYVSNVLDNIEEYEAVGLEPAHDVPADGSEQGRVAVEWAMEKVGLPYIWGGTGPEGYDCSGLTQGAWAAAGVSIPRVTTDQVDIGSPVSLDELAPGDLLFYDTGSGPSPSHVTIYAGDGQMVNAPRTGTNIRVEPVASEYYSPRFVSAVRPG